MTPTHQEHFRRMVAAYAAKPAVEHEIHRLKVLHRNRMRNARSYAPDRLDQPYMRLRCLAEARVIRRWMRPLRRTRLR